MRTTINLRRRNLKGSPCLLRTLAIVTSLFFFLAGMAWANPKDGKVVSGSAQFNTQGNTLTVTNTPNAIINWKSFSIDASETTRFVQQNASSAVLNRIKGQDPSVILGSLQSNGKVLLINPNGVIFGQGSRVDVNGLVASTLNISNEDFLAGKYNFNAGDITGKIQNQGTITTPTGGMVYLIAPDIENSGIISSPKGDVILAAGHSVQLFDSFDPNIAVVVSAPEDKAVNLGQIIAESGKVGIYGGLITQKGTVSADSAVVGENGRIFFKATKDVTLDKDSTTSAKKGDIRIFGGMEDGIVDIAGIIDASAPYGGDGGFIETSAACVKVKDTAKVTTLAPYGKIGEWLIDPPDFTIASTDGDIDGTTLGGLLSSSNVTIHTAEGTDGPADQYGETGTNGDIFVNDTVTWNANTLILDAFRNIEINSTLNGSGTASLALYYGQGAAASGNTATYKINAPVNLPAGNNFSTKLGSDGTEIVYTVITELGLQGDKDSSGHFTLQGLANGGMLSGHYALGANIVASGTLGWGSGTTAGFFPIGTASTPFTGIFDGLGHAITGLYINRTGINYVSLFGYANISSVIKNTGMVNVNITGWGDVGGLVGYNYYGSITNSYSTAGAVKGFGEVGGLVGYNVGHIDNSYSANTVTYSLPGINPGYFGGLVGWNGGTIANSSSTGSVTATGDCRWVGGLAGINYAGSITGSYSTGPVTAGTGNYVGGLVGTNRGGLIDNSHHITGVVTGTGDFIGGLAGSNERNGSMNAIITNSYNEANVQGASNVGGLVGANAGGSIDNSHHSVGLVKGSDFVGGLVGSNEGYVDGDAIITNSYNTADVQGESHVGGLIGYNEGRSGRAEIRDSHNSGNVTATGDYVGGLVGDSYAYYDDPDVPGGVLIINSNNTGAVYTDGTTAADPTLSYVGGLVGYHSGEGNSASEINNCYNIGAVTAPGNYVGGLVGYNEALVDPSDPTVPGDVLITQSHNTGVISGGSFVGGLAGYSEGNITNSYNDITGQVNGDSWVGGLVGHNYYTGSIANSFNEGSVNGTGIGTIIGGLVGYNYGSIANSYSTGSVTGTNDVGGLVGYNGTDAAAGIIRYSYSTGQVNSAGSRVGGFIGHNRLGVFTSNYWDTTTSGRGVGVGENGDTDMTDFTGLITGLTTPQMRQMGSFAGWLIAANGGSTAIWRIYEGSTYPLLRSFLTPASITASNAAKTYDGTPYNGGNGYTYSTGSWDADYMGVFAYGGDSQGAINAGSYAIAPGGYYSHQQGYDINFINGTLTINKAALTITAMTNTKTYDGTTSAAATPVITSGNLLGGDTATFTEVYADQNAGTGKILIPSAVISDGNGGNNYNVMYINNTKGVINRYPVTMTGTRSYDGTDIVDAGIFTLSQLVGNETLTLTGSGTIADKNVGNNKAVNLGTIALADGTGMAAATKAALPGTTSSGIAANYILTGTQTVDITPAAQTLTITANNDSKAYDGVAYSGGNGVAYSGFVGGENESVLGGTLSYGGNSQGAVHTGNYVITPGGLTSGNYIISFLDGILTINAAEKVDRAYQNPVYVTMLNDQGIGKSTTIFEFSGKGLDTGSDNEQACAYCDEMFPNLD